jgi:hypothetical protein
VDLGTGDSGAILWLDEDRGSLQHLYHDVENQLRVVRPAVLRKYVPTTMVGELRALAPTYGYSLSVDLTAFPEGPVRLLFKRKDQVPITPRPRPVSANTRRDSRVNSAAS